MSANDSPGMLREEIARCREAWENCRRPKAAARLRALLDQMETRLAVLTHQPA